MYSGKPLPSERFGAGLITAGIVFAVAWVLMISLSFVRGDTTPPGLPTIATIALPKPPPPPVVPDRQPSREPEGAAAPPNIRSTPTEVVAPTPPLIIAPPPPIVTAPIAGTGSDASAGAAEVPGPGTGAGGIGDGRGSGGAGDGTGGGLRDETPPRQIRGELRFSDATRIVPWEQLIGREMTTRFTVGIDGRVSQCEATRSSGVAALDAHICRLIEQRFRYEPSRDGRGRPVRSGVIENHSWDQRF